MLGERLKVIISNITILLRMVGLLTNINLKRNSKFKVRYGISTFLM